VDQLGQLFTALVLLQQFYIVKSWKSAFGLGASAVLVAIGTYQLIDAAQAEEFDSFIAGRMTGSGLLIASGLLIYRFARKKETSKKS